jgi:hypothetical protein
MSNSLNGSQYVQSLVDFINDTKPYHSKLTEVIEEYRFFDDVNVKMVDATSVRSMHKAAWLYNFFSDGNKDNNTFLAQRVVSPNFVGTDKNSDPANNLGRWKAQRDELTDMVLVPLVFSKKQFDGVGIADAWIEYGGTSVIPYVEGHDFFQSHGSLEFSVRKIRRFELGPEEKVVWVDTRADGIISAATAAVQALELNADRPQSALQKLKELTNTVKTQLTANARPDSLPYISALTACDSLLLSLDSGIIPPGYTTSPGNPDLVLTGEYDLIIDGAATALPPIPPPTGYAGWRGEDGVPLAGPTPARSLYIDEAYSSLLPALLLNLHGDQELYEDGELSYRPTQNKSLAVYGIVTNPNSVAFEEWTLETIEVFPPTYTVTGSTSGLLGTVIAGTNFITTQLTFSSTHLATPKLGDKLLLTPYNLFSIHPSAPLETWNVIKVNPIAYSRPAFTSLRYGYIQDLSEVIGKITLLDTGIKAGTIVLTAISATEFLLTSTAEPEYTATVTVGEVYDDGILGFTIMAGSNQPFVPGDRFFIEIENVPLNPKDFDLYYGYDLDSYDNPDLVYNNTDQLNADYARKIEFRFDSRFTDYDLDAMNLTIQQNAVDRRQFRMVAVPDLTRPIITLKQNQTTMSNDVDLAAEDHEVPPGISGTSVFSMPGDANPAVDLQMYYSDTFRIEYSDDGFVTTNVFGTIDVGETFVEVSIGISFTLVAGSKPFIAVSSDDGLGSPRVEGGDMFSFTVDNPPPLVTTIPIGLIGATVPRLIMHGDSYYRSIPAKWIVSMTSPSAYTLTGTYTMGSLSGTVVTGYPVTGTLSLPGVGAIEGATYRDINAHFTIVSGRGLALGDSFTFTTYEHKPSFLVHGSVSSWQRNAEYDKWYWNGLIGFKINSPTVELYRKVLHPAFVGDTSTGIYLDPLPAIGGYYNFSSGWVRIEYVRPDAPAISYTFKKMSNGWQVTRSDLGVVGWTELSSTFADNYLTAVINDIGEDFVIVLKSDNYDFWNAQDAAIVRSTITSLNPTADDFVVFKKTENGSIEIALDYGAMDVPISISALGPLAVDADYVDTSTNLGGVPLSRTSPETNILENWLPTFTKKYDSRTSIAEFPDSVSIYEVYSSSTGQLIGSLKPQATALKEPTDFIWDKVFFEAYLPLNAQANIVTYGTGLDENVRVLISEKLHILLSGSAIFENAQFQDSFSVNLDEEHQLNILINPADAVITTVQDGPFGGFLAGYDNLPYDAEDALNLNQATLAAARGIFDTGLPLVDHYLRAQFLATIVSPTQVQAQELADLLPLISFHLQAGGITATTLPQFLAELDADPYVQGGMNKQGFGIPTVGTAIDINATSTDVGSTRIQESFSIQSASNPSPYDVDGFDTLPLDAVGSRAAVMFVTSGLPIPTMAVSLIEPTMPTINDIWLNPSTLELSAWDGSTWVAKTYITLSTPLEVIGSPVSTFDISFLSEPLIQPTFKMWRPGELALEPVGVVTKISPRVYRFTTTQPTEVKIIAF